MHETLVAMAKSWGLFYLIAMSVVIVAYAFWPSNQKGFEQARRSILEKDDKPWK
ncbi:cbb3-type cytochrome c oxidase subunit 3 [Salmonella enterica subsp. enterica serovar Virchow]|nr:cbb3-type cytochrome c oxidase subunit 3 [Salmonella enterica subsp. enterica]EBV3599685.1 cbb3-type cytochrome c oxidase subunit 3 [Salmonella enterica subsp. enterica serovar Virchow]EBW2353118.1 cbb3-type cytochrome c oxidase subunit 3 [Salmonella enterica subsp. enterica serovar Enteritidis]ECI7685746.1 cbb3-type cytochrome c oxidase subunit 3 [Salmonella enterica subsp. enterica serovar Paratyphi A]EFG8199697.1 cbb3-type cytochrome c oxidase subunit 3 [Escherichia coli]